MYRASLRIVILASLLFGLPLTAREKTDVIVMKNGDRWTGEIKALNAGVLYVSLSYVDGTVSVNWSQVARIESKQPFIVRMADGTVYAGVLKTVDKAADSPVTLEVFEENTSLELKRDGVAEVDQTSLQFWRRFNGNVGLGLNYTKGNNATQYNFNSDVGYLRERWSVDVGYTSNLSANEGSKTSTRNEVSVSGQHLLPWKNYFYAGIADFLQSSTQGIDLQTTLGGGIGKYLKRSNRVIWTVTGGVGWQSTAYRTTLVTENRQQLAAAIIATRLQVFTFKKTNLDFTANLLPVLSDPGRVKFNTNASYFLKIFGNFDWNISFFGNWDNRPPPTFAGSDYGTSSGISWKFGNR